MKLSGRMAIISWICQICAASIIGRAGINKLMMDPNSLEVFRTLGSGETLLIVIGVLEVLAAVLLITPFLVKYGAVLSLGVMIGALIAHVSRLGFTGAMAILSVRLFVMLGLLFVILYIHRRSLPLIGQTFDD